MAAPRITLEVLPAGFGDCLLVSCPIDGGTWRMLIDTGPDEAYPALRQRLLALPIGGDGKRHIDLLVITHIDHDHIGGIQLLLADASLGLSFGDVWFNAPPQRRVRGVAEGQALANILGAPACDLPWNKAWDGGPVATPPGSGGTEVTGNGLPRLTVLSPTPGRLDALFVVWAKELEKLRRKERDLPEPQRPATRSGALNLEALASKQTSPDRAVANGSSIAILLEHQGASILLSGDAFADVLAPELRALAARRGTASLTVDVHKLSHHGSRANITTDLIQAVQARHCVISTNNSYFRHPNAEAMARVIVGAASVAQKPVLWFNHDTEQNRQWADPELMTHHGYEVRFPKEGELGVTIELQTQTTERTSSR